MRWAALILGVLGGALSLVYGAMGFWLAAVQPSPESEIICLLATLPGLGGAVVVLWKPTIGAGMMAGAAVVTLGMMGLNFFTAVPVILFAMAAALGFVASRRSPA
jgi:hypothetical protein